MVALVGLAVWGWARPTATAPAAEVTRLTATLPQDHRVHLPDWNVFPLALSEDGRSLAYVGESLEGTAIYVRRLDGYEATRLEGTRGASQPFFSPDGTWLAYFAAGRLHRVSIGGGAPIPIAPVAGIPAGGAWGGDDLVVFAVDSALWRVSVGGGEPERVPWAAPGSVGWPSFLPSGSGGWGTPSVLVSAGADLFAVSLVDGEARPIGVAAGGQGAVAGGFLVYTETSGVVRAVPFDARSLRVTGTAISVLEDVLRPNLTDATVLTLSRSGTLAYMAGTSARRLVLVDRSGRERALGFPPGAYRNLSVSPEGRRILADRRGERQRILDLGSGADNPVDGGLVGAWSPDGREVLTSSGRGNLARLSATPGSPERRTYPSLPGQNVVPADWGADGTALFFTIDQRAERRGGLFTTRLAEGAVPETLLDTEAHELYARRSPDGRWLGYTSDVSGIPEVYVRRFAGGEPRQVSVNGGDRLLFSRDGRELFYVGGERMYAVPVEQLEDPAPLEPELLFTGSYVLLGASLDVRPQGDFVMVSAGPSWLREILVVQNWTTELEQLFSDQAR
jgi:serine/threonine-protein kinase